jgi:hypothetical protein
MTGCEEKHDSVTDSGRDSSSYVTPSTIFKRKLNAYVECDKTALSDEKFDGCNGMDVTARKTRGRGRSRRSWRPMITRILRVPGQPNRMEELI